MWHASVSAWSPAGQLLELPALVEREAVRLLRGVGGEREWWIHSAGRVGHLRVGLTAAEVAGLSAGVAVDDAGEAGPERPRTA